MHTLSCLPEKIKRVSIQMSKVNTNTISNYSDIPEKNPFAHAVPLYGIMLYRFSHNHNDNNACIGPFQ